MEFAAGMMVFPGGGVDASDTPDAGLWSGPPPAEWGRRLQVEPALAERFVSAAVRETFEECGVLLAAGALPDPAVLGRERDDVLARRRTLTDVLRGHGLALQADLLRPWARWITPPGYTRRYDTAFFVAAVPPGQEADARTSEAVRADWWSPAVALAEEAAERAGLMPPTRRCLQDLAGFDDTAQLFAVADTRVIEVVRPAERAVHVLKADGTPVQRGGLR
jgi:8-oxo-dGTP pyrophosphatase MutT (NUDIX family)